jgi:molybdenum cofactor cytidylyltransferase
MGRPKALLEYRGETFAGRLVRTLGKCCDPVFVVIAHHADEIRARVAANFVVNPDPDRGQLSSLQCALSERPGGIEGFLFTPVDCPVVEESTVTKLIQIFREHQHKIVIPRFQEKRGHPVCVPGSLVEDFLALAPTEQTRRVIDANADRILYIDVDDAGVLTDVDDPAAYRALKA